MNIVTGSKIYQEKTFQRRMFLFGYNYHVQWKMHIHKTSRNNTLNNIVKYMKTGHKHPFIHSACMQYSETCLKGTPHYLVSVSKWQDVLLSSVMWKIWNGSEQVSPDQRVSSKCSVLDDRFYCKYLIDIEGMINHRPKVTLEYNSVDFFNWVTRLLGRHIWSLFAQINMKS